MPISGLGPLIGLPSSRTSPAVRPWSPDIDQSSVVLPQPDGPTIETISSDMTSERASLQIASSRRSRWVTLVALSHPEFRLTEHADVSLPHDIPEDSRPAASQGEAAPLYSLLLTYFCCQATPAR